MIFMLVKGELPERFWYSAIVDGLGNRGRIPVYSLSIVPFSKSFISPSFLVYKMTDNHIHLTRLL